MKTLRLYSALALFAFVFNFLWEYSALPFYKDYSALGQGLSLVLWASAGDVVYVLFIISVVAYRAKKSAWMLEGKREDYALAGALGFLVALFVEYKALYLHRWAYATAMPIIPILGVGLTPIIQMTLIAPLSAWLLGRTLKHSLLYSPHESR